MKPTIESHYISTHTQIINCTTMRREAGRSCISVWNTEAVLLYLTRHLWEALPPLGDRALRLCWRKQLQGNDGRHHSSQKWRDRTHFGKERTAFFSKFLYNWVLQLIFFPISTLASLEFREINSILKQFVNISHVLILPFRAYWVSGRVLSLGGSRGEQTGETSFLKGSEGTAMERKWR